MPLSKSFQFLKRSPFHCFIVVLVYLSSASVSSAQENPFGQTEVAPQETPVVDPFSSVPSAPASPTTEPAVSPFSAAAPQTETPVTETPQPMTDAPSPFETADPIFSHDETQMPAVATPTAEPPQDVVDPFSTVSPDAGGDQESPVATEKPNEEEAIVDGTILGESTLGLDAPASEEKEETAADTDVIEKQPAPVRPPIAAQPASPWISVIWGLWPYLAGILGLILLWLLSKMFLGKTKNKFDAPVENNRELDPSKSSFKKSERFSDSAIDGVADSGSDVISDVGEVSGLRLNESDVLSESPEVPDQSDLNFDAFESTTVDGDFKVSDDGLDDDDFAAMMLEDDDQEKIAGDAENAVSIDEVDDFKIEDADLEPQMAENIVVQEEVSATLDDGDSDEFSFDLDDDDSVDAASEAVADKVSEVDDEFTLEDTEAAPEIASEATIEDSDEFDFGLDDDDSVESASEAVADKASEVNDEFCLLYTSPSPRDS